MWFAFALLSAVFAGLHTFILKVSVEQKYDTYLLSAISACVSALLGIVLVFFFSSWDGIPFMVYFYSVLSGLLFAGFTIARMEGLRYLDAAIFFPLYKVIGPAFAALMGIFLLQEHVTSAEVIGIILSCLVPILLITKQEDHRQKNLRLGLLLMLVGTTLSAIAAAANAVAVHGMTQYIFPVAAVANAFGCITSALLYLRKHPKGELYHNTRTHLSRGFITTTILNGCLQMAAFCFLLAAFALGDLSVVYSINAHYILIPVLLSVWLYKEHWNTQKAIALIVSILALILLHP